MLPGDFHCIKEALFDICQPKIAISTEVNRSTAAGPSGTDGWTPYHYTEPALHTIQASGESIYTSCYVSTSFIIWHYRLRNDLYCVEWGVKLYSNQALTLLVGRQEEHPACKNRVMRCWCGYLTAVRCRLFAHGPADATAIPKPHHFSPHVNPDWFYLSGSGLPRLSWKRGC